MVNMEHPAGHAPVGRSFGEANIDRRTCPTRSRRLGHRVERGQQSEVIRSARRRAKAWLSLFPHIKQMLMAHSSTIRRGTCGKGGNGGNRISVTLLRHSDISLKTMIMPEYVEMTSAHTELIRDLIPLFHDRDKYGSLHSYTLIHYEIMSTRNHLHYYTLHVSYSATCIRPLPVNKGVKKSWFIRINGIFHRYPQ
jgi:hypothetical protein